MLSKESGVLIFSVFIAGLCSIVYELLIATTSSYFLGDSITQFSITIGAYMAAMGIGSYLSRLLSDENLLHKFVLMEILLGVVGGLSIPLLYLAFSYTASFQLSSIILTVIIGILIGFEIPLLSRLMASHYSLKINISNVLSVDYLGALIATLIFPFLLLPWLGVFRTSLFFGLINMSIAVVVILSFASVLGTARRKVLTGYLVISVTVMVSVLVFSGTLLQHWNNNLYTDRIVYTEESPYQHIVVTRHKDDLRLFLNGNLQFSASDEYRYHEALVQIPMHVNENVRHVLLLGGGDGLGVREVLKHTHVESITLVDLDPAITRLGSENPHFIRLNGDSLNHGKVTVINQDAFVYLKETPKRFDLIIVDLPDPNNVSLSRLYTKEFYRLLEMRLSSHGLFDTQATSPFYARQAYWAIHNTIAAGGFSTTIPYHTYVPSFGEWGFVMACRRECDINRIDIGVSTRYLSNNALPKLFTFEKDIARIETEINTLDKPKLLSYYLEGWRYWN